MLKISVTFAALLLAAAPAMAQVETIDPNQAAGAYQPSGADEQADPYQAEDRYQPAPDPAAPRSEQRQESADEYTPIESAPPPPAPPAESGSAAFDARNIPVTEETRVPAGDVLAAAEGVFGRGARGLANIVEGILREQGEPVAYITGRRAFWTIELEVGPGVLVPRPDSEALIEAAVECFGDRTPRRILDLGTGPGTLLLAALDQWQDSTGIGVDASEEALVYARRNSGPRAEFRLGDWGEGIDERFDLILCNPPYVEAGAALAADVADWEPDVALYAGPDGLGCYRVIAPQLRRLLAPDGIACLEIGMGQAPAVREILAGEGFTAESRNDLNGVERCLIVAG